MEGRPASRRPPYSRLHCDHLEWDVQALATQHLKVTCCQLSSLHCCRRQAACGGADAESQCDARLQSLRLEDAAIVVDGAPGGQVVCLAYAIQQRLLVRRQAALAWLQVPSMGASPRVAAGSIGWHAMCLTCSSAQSAWYQGQNKLQPLSVGAMRSRCICGMARKTHHVSVAHLWHQVTIMMRPPGAHTRASSPTNRSLSGLAQHSKWLWSHECQENLDESV